MWNITLSGRVILKQHGECQCVVVLFSLGKIFMESSRNIPPSLREYYKETGQGVLPTPKVKQIRSLGMWLIFCLLCKNCVYRRIYCSV